MKDLLARKCFRDVLKEWALFLSTKSSPEDFSWCCELWSSMRKQWPVGQDCWEFGKLIRGRSWDYILRRMPQDLEPEIQKEFRKTRAKSFFARFKTRYISRIDDYLVSVSA